MKIKGRKKIKRKQLKLNPLFLGQGKKKQKSTFIHLITSQLTNNLLPAPTTSIREFQNTFSGNFIHHIKLLKLDTSMF